MLSKNLYESDNQFFQDKFQTHEMIIRNSLLILLQKIFIRILGNQVMHYNFLSISSKNLKTSK